MINFYGKQVSDGMYVIQYNYRSRYLVTNDIKNEIKFYNYVTYHVKETFLTLQLSKICLVKSRICAMTEMSGTLDNHDLDDNFLGGGDVSVSRV